MVRRAVLVLLLCAGCAPRAATTPATVAGRLARFVAAVPPFEEGGACRRVDEGRRVMLQFTGPGVTRRDVSVEVDAQGNVLSYSDVRGDVRIDGTGPRTSIMVDLGKDTGFAMNDHVSPREVATGGAAEAMDLENLGNPRRMIELLRRRCMDGQG